MTDKEKKYKRLVNQLPETIAEYDRIDEQHEILNKEAAAIKKKYGRGREGKKKLIPVLMKLESLYEELDVIYRPTRKEVIGRTFINGTLRFLEEHYGED